MTAGAWRSHSHMLPSAATASSRHPEAARKAGASPNCIAGNILRPAAVITCCQGVFLRFLHTRETTLQSPFNVSKGFRLVSYLQYLRPAAHHLRPGSALEVCAHPKNHLQRFLRAETLIWLVMCTRSDNSPFNCHCLRPRSESTEQ